MSSSDAMFQASSMYFQYVNERAAHVKIDRVSRRFDSLNVLVSSPKRCVKYKRKQRGCSHNALNSFVYVPAMTEQNNIVYFGLFVT